MSEFSVSVLEVKNRADELKQLNTSLKSQIDDLVNSEVQLVGMWEGEARDTFDAAFKTDKSQMELFTALIDRFADTLTAIAARYSLAESQNVQTAQTRNYR